MTRMIRNIAISILALVLLFFLLQQLNLVPSFKKLFSPAPLLIENSPVLIKEIHGLAQLMTYTSFDEVVVDSVKVNPERVAVRTITGINLNPLEPLYERIVLIGKGRVIAGTDLNNISDKNIYIKEDSISLALPKATILDVIINPSGFETFSETGHWSPEEVMVVKNKARKKMTDRALEKNILSKANEQAVKLMGEFLKGLNFKKISVNVQDND